MLDKALYPCMLFLAYFYLEKSLQMGARPFRLKTAPALCPNPTRRLSVSKFLNRFAASH